MRKPTPQGLTAALLAAAGLLTACQNSSSAASDSTSFTAKASAATYQSILLNEIQSSATTGSLNADFIELYNTSTEAYTFVEGEWYLTDSDGSPTHVFKIPGGQVLAAGGHLVILPDSTAVPADAPSGALSVAEAGDGSVGFGLGKTDSVSLFYTGSDNSDAGTAVQTSSWSGTHVMTRVRLPDGGDWNASDVHVPTPGETNQ